MGDMMGMVLGYTEDRLAEQLRAEIHRMVDVVGLAYLDDLRWTVQQYAAKCLNEAVEDRKRKPKS